MSRTETFLDLYKQLEEELELKYRNSKRRYSSVVFEYSKDPQSESVREKLDVVREIRNLLTHNPNIDGQAIVEPSEPVIRALEEILEFVKDPPKALEYATKGESIMKATLANKVLRLMEVMDKNGFSHIPVMRDGYFIGVFSIGTVFRYVVRRGEKITPETTLKDMADFLPVADHLENYGFLPKDASFFQARGMFETVKAKNKRVAVIFITETGKSDERLLGMLTPWDVMSDPTL